MKVVLLLVCLVVFAEAKSLDKRIVGGSDTTIEDYPHQVSLRSSSGSHNCGASIISEKWVVTAAHCVDGSSASSLSILAGTTDRLKGGTEASIKSVNVHPDYDFSGPGFPNDIALLELTSELEFSDSIQAIALADESTGDLAGDNCVISGWGLTNEEPGLPTILQEVSMTVLTNTDCTDKWSTVSGADINAGHICIGTAADSGKSACNGDSGGPMTCGSGKNKVLAGATSWGISGCGVGYPSVYTRISHFRDWVKQTSGV